MSTWIDAIKGACLVHVEEDLDLMVVWNGSATFNVYANLDSPEELASVDCFTRYACEKGYDPRDAGMSWAEGRRWAVAQISDWVSSVLAGEPLSGRNSTT